MDSNHFYNNEHDNEVGCGNVGRNEVDGSDSNEINSSGNNTVVNITLNNSNITLKPKELVYLTSDATETLHTLDKNCTYIIGGIVDRNRYKKITYDKAQYQHIRTAKLPIHEYFQLTTTHVLTVNHVFEILLNYSKYNDWYEAIKQVIPSRKGLHEK